MARKKETVCPHNEACRCAAKDCFRCGWNPAVAKIRMAKIQGKQSARG